MVLLTSSAISVAITSGIVFLFTFLLFLSGYILQQQTVKSLQEALQAPVEVRVRVQPGLQAHFETAEDVLVAADTGDGVVVEGIEVPGEDKPVDEIVLQVPDTLSENKPEPLNDVEQEQSPQQLWHAHVDSTLDQPPNDGGRILNDPVPYIDDSLNMRLAYVLSMPTPADLCSALLFTKWHRHSSSYPRSQFNIIYLYPSDWEVWQKPVYKDALRLLLEAEHKYSVLLHPVQISKVWTGIDVESQLLSELARNPWIYDRVMYVRSPGILLDTTRLDDTVVSSYVDRNIIKTQWAKLRAPVRRGDTTTLHPDVLLFAQGRGLMIPTAGSAKRTVAKIRTKQANKQPDDFRDELLAREAAYVAFDDAELESRRKGENSHDELLERFERERQAICDGTLLLS